MTHSAPPFHLLHKGPANAGPLDQPLLRHALAFLTSLNRRPSSCSYDGVLNLHHLHLAADFAATGDILIWVLQGSAACRQIISSHESLQVPLLSFNPSCLGIGLFIVKAICSAHGGQVEGASEEGRGARFRGLLPLAETSDETKD